MFRSRPALPDGPRTKSGQRSGRTGGPRASSATRVSPSVRTGSRPFPSAPCPLPMPDRSDSEPMAPFRSHLARRRPYPDTARCMSPWAPSAVEARGIVSVGVGPLSPVGPPLPRKVAALSADAWHPHRATRRAAGARSRTGLGREATTWEGSLRIQPRSQSDCLPMRQARAHGPSPAQRTRCVCRPRRRSPSRNRG